MKKRKAQISALLDQAETVQSSLAQPWIQLWDVIYARAQEQYITDLPEESRGEVLQLLAGLHNIREGLGTREVSRLNKVFGPECFRQNINRDEYERYRKIAQQAVLNYAAEDFLRELRALNSDPDHTAKFMQLIIDLANARQKK